MRLVIFGAGPVGNALARLATKAHYDLVVVEADASRAQHCADRIDARVLHATAADEGLAEEAGLEHADVLIATTTDDATNFMAATLAKRAGIKAVLSTVNAPCHAPLFSDAGIQILTAPENLVAQYLFDQAHTGPDAELVTLLSLGSLKLAVFSVDQQSPWVGQTGETLDAYLPRGFRLALIDRPDGELVADQHALEAGDKVLIASRKPIETKRLAATLREFDPDSSRKSASNRVPEPAASDDTP